MELKFKTNTKQIIFMVYLLFFLHAQVSSINIKLQTGTRSEGCSIKLRKMPRDTVEAVSFISTMQDDLDFYDICKGKKRK